MKLAISLALFASVAAASAHDMNAAQHARLAKRQSASGSSSSSSSDTNTPTPTTPPATTSSPGLPPITLTGTQVPPISYITSGMPSEATVPLRFNYSPGMVPSGIPGAPPLPAYTIIPSQWPPVDKVAPTSDPEVDEWMQELNGWTIPDINPTKDGTCAGDPAAAADAANRGWWSCGHYTRSTDIVTCPDKMTWGVSFDDGPASYTPTLLDYLTESNLKATFFVVGSRVIEYPDTLVQEYMDGHEISVHTWAHSPLTSLTTRQIVAELGYTRKAIKTVLGVTPTTMRPPYGDIDDRVRAISMAMGLQPIVWTVTPAAGAFDTNDWRVAGGLITGPQQMDIFESILGNATTMDTGFIVLQHDLFEITVDLARGYTLNAAQTHQPPFALEMIGQCQHWPEQNMYLETTLNKTFPTKLAVSTSAAATGTAGTGAAASGGAASPAATSGAIPVHGFSAALALAVAGVLACIAL